MPGLGWKTDGHASWAQHLPIVNRKAGTYERIVDAGCRVLEKDGFRVATATGGLEALELMRQQPRDIIVLDLEMPDLDGAATLKKIRKEWGLLPVIIQTGYAEGELMTRALECSPFTLLSKPCSPERLAATVRGLAQPSTNSPWNQPPSERLRIAAEPTLP